MVLARPSLPSGRCDGGYIQGLTRRGADLCVIDPRGQLQPRRDRPSMEGWRLLRR